MLSSSMLALSSSAACVRVDATAAWRWAFSRRAASAAARPVSGSSGAGPAARGRCGSPNPGAGACAGSGAAASQAGACAGVLGAALIGVTSAGAADSRGVHESAPSSKFTEAPPEMTTGSPQPVGVDGVYEAGSMGASSKTGDEAWVPPPFAVSSCASAGNGSPG